MKFRTIFSKQKVRFAFLRFCCENVHKLRFCRNVNLCSQCRKRTQQRKQANCWKRNRNQGSKGPALNKKKKNQFIVSRGKKFQCFLLALQLHATWRLGNTESDTDSNAIPHRSLSSCSLFACICNLKAEWVVVEWYAWCKHFAFFDLHWRKTGWCFALSYQILTHVRRIHLNVEEINW